MSKRKVYLDDISLDEAWRRLIVALEAAGLWQPFEGEEMPLDQALGRVTAAPVWARLSSPHYHAAAMDGYAVRARDTASASEATPVQLALDTQAKYVDTGDPLPPWADAVIPIENVQAIEVGENPPISNLQSPTSRIEIRASVTPWSHVRPMGEDMVATELVLPANHTLRPVDLGAIAGCGHATVLVRRKPRVAVIPTGTELVPVGSAVKPGDILEYNSLVLAAQVEQWGGAATRHPIVPDDFERLQAAVAEAAAANDLVLLNAGSSAGSEDFSARIVESLGTLLVHGIAVRPGHPVIMGMLQPPISNLKSPTPIIGTPGYPVSAALTGEIFVEPILSKWLGRAPQQPPTLEAVITRKVLSPIGDDEYLRVTVGRVGSRVVATPLSRGAGVITSLVRADGIVRIPRHHEGLNAGDKVTVQLYRSPDEIARTIVAIGSHDLTLDLLAQFLAERGTSPSGGGTHLSSANVGSQGGLVALRRGEAHLAGSHLLDPDTGEYNVSYVKKYLPDTPVVLVTLVGREQGLIVKPGNPKTLRTLADLGQPDVIFVNRQRGAGTRVLLDFEIEKIGLKPEEIRGYDREEYTHLAVAAAVASGVADCGLGIAAAARALELDFVPLFKERYDLIIPHEHYTSPLLRPLLDLLRDARFREQVAALPGYDIAPMGNVVAELL
ncbi:MAG: molybdopterin biosynthesis protein [Anaerolineales bacterium]|nr:molybdopterin biosynthesis protein [Anaerolineales bacterium]